MNKKYVFFVLFCLILSAIFVFAGTQEKTNLKDVILHPENYDRLPDNLAPYCCGEVINGRCNGKVDLETAANFVKRGLNPSAKYSPPREALRCD